MIIKLARNTLLIFAIGLIVVAAYAHFLAGMYGDKLWEMLYATMWVDGRQLYRDLFAVSPPLIFWLYAPAAAISQHFWAGSDFQALWLMGLILIASCIFICLQLIKVHPGFTSRARWTEWAMLLGFLLIFRTNPHYFLDREHLFVVLTLPYLLRYMPGLAGAILPGWISVMVGAMAGIGFCLKPQCLVVFISVQLLFFIFQRSLRILYGLENAVIYGLSILYLLLVFWLYPEYFTVIVPMALATYSAARDETPVFVYASNAIYTLIPTLLFVNWRTTSPYRRDILYWCGMCASALAYALLNNNWAYTYYPLSSFAIIVTALVLWEFVAQLDDGRGSGFKRWAVWLGIIACSATFLFRVVVSLSYFWVVIQYGCYDSINCMQDEPFAAELNGSANTFGTISVDFTRWSRLSRYTGAVWQTRFPQLWMLPKFFMSDEQFTHEHQWIINYVGNAFAEDMNTKKPDVMFVDDTQIFYTAHTQADLVTYLEAVPAFKEAWSHYHFFHKLDRCASAGEVARVNRFECSYSVYRRN